MIGCTFSSVKFPGRAPQGMVLLRAFLGGALQPGMCDLDDDAMTRTVREGLRALLGIQAAPSLVSIRRHRKAMPQYHVGHLARLEAIEAKMASYPTLSLTGSGYRGIGIPDCLHQAERTAERIILQARDVVQRLVGCA